MWAEMGDYLSRQYVMTDSTISIVSSQGYEGFIGKLRSSQALEDDLPVYAAGLPYYQRLFASALSRSLKASLVKGEQLGLGADAWLAKMPRDAYRLFEGAR